MQKKSAFVLFLLLWIVLQGLSVALWILGNWNDHVLAFLAVYLIFFATYCVAVHHALAKSFDQIPHLGRWIILSALLLRVVVLPCSPSLSEDFYRYIWDGRTQASGLSPYTYPPEAAELQFLRNDDYAHINHKDVGTPYPPFAETLFHLFSRISSNHGVFKAGIVSFDFLLIFVLLFLFRRKNLSPAFLVLYAWHPLPIVEFAGNAHVDIIAISLMMLAYYYVQNSEKVLAGAFLAAATLTKYVPLLALPWIVKKGNWKVFLSFVISCVLIALPFYFKETNMFGGLFLFYKKWRFNDSLFGLLYVTLGGAEPARICGAIFTAAMVIFCFVKSYSIYRSFLYCYGTMLLFSPVVHPWYVCWLIPVLAFYPSKPWLFFSGWIAISYLIRYLFPTGEWHEPLWLRLLVYLPLFLLLIIQAFRKPSPELLATAKG
jgi:hypothetical protein